MIFQTGQTHGHRFGVLDFSYRHTVFVLVRTHAHYDVLFFRGWKLFRLPCVYVFIDFVFRVKTRCLLKMRIQKLHGACKLRLYLFVDFHESQCLVTFAQLVAPSTERWLLLGQSSHKYNKLFNNKFECPVHHLEIVNLLGLSVETLKEACLRQWIPRHGVWVSFSVLTVHASNLIFLKRLLLLGQHGCCFLVIRDAASRWRILLDLCHFW